MPKKPPEATENCTILKGPSGAVYSISDATLEAHRLPKDEEATVRKVYEEKIAGTPDDPPGEFEILGRGPVVRRFHAGVPTADGWFDQYA